MKQINCDLGECLIPNPDEVIMPLIDMANIACGGHVGDRTSMDNTVTLAKRHGVKVGAHPSYDDKDNFGRISHDVTLNVLYEAVFSQVTDLQERCHYHQIEMSYIKPHGALYHDMMMNPDVLDVLCQVITAVNPSLSLVVQAGSHQEQMINKATQTSINFIYEAFADRAYRNKQMISRSESGAMLRDAKEIVAQYRYFSQYSDFRVDTICFHSDHLASVIALQLIRGGAQQGSINV